MVKGDDFLLENQDILGGIKTAIEHGAELRDAMMTLFSAGYDKAKIEEAAKRYLEQKQTEKPKIIPEQKKVESKKSEKKKKIKFTSVSPGVQQRKPKTKQQVSKYGSTAKKKPANSSKTITILLILVLVFLLGMLTAVFLFKNELVDFFNRLFG